MVRQDQARHLHVRGAGPSAGRQAGPRKDLHLLRSKYVIEYEREIGFSTKMDAIRGYRNSNTKLNSLTDKQKLDILVVVDFFNHIAHLTRNGYIRPRQILMMYWPSLDDCNEIIIKQLKWLDDFRNKWGKEFYHQFETLCNPKSRELVWRWEDERNIVVWEDNPKAIRPAHVLRDAS